MKKTETVASSALLFLLLGTSLAVAQEDEADGPDAVPVEAYACNYHDGMGPADLDAVIDEWNEWMDDETREQALLKLSTFEPKIGYTEKWTDYGPLEIKGGALLENAFAITEFQWQEQLDRLGGAARPGPGGGYGQVRRFFL